MRFTVPSRVLLAGRYRFNIVPKGRDYTIQAVGHRGDTGRLTATLKTAKATEDGINALIRNTWFPGSYNSYEEIFQTWEEFEAKL